MSKLKPVVLSGPSGCGKSTIIKKIMSEHKELFGFSVSHTTRQPRPKEVDGIDYKFTDRKTMEQQVAEGLFIESAVFGGNMYGTSKQAVQDVINDGRICILDIDSQGVQSIKRLCLDYILIFIKPPCIAELERRLRKRGTETEELIAKRMEACHKELEYALKPDSFHYTIINDDLDTAYNELKDIINKELSVF